MRLGWGRLATPALLLAAGLLAGCATPAPPCAPPQPVFVGTDGGQLRALRLDRCQPALSPIGPVADLPKPRWTLAHPALPVLFAAAEDRVSAFRVDAASGALTLLNQVSSGGSGNTHLWLDAPSMTLLVASFGSGSVASLPIASDGRLGDPVSVLKASGSGPHRRQASPHAHGVAIDPSGRWALVPDLGADRVFVYGFDRASRRLLPDTTGRAFATPPGSGPRRVVFGAGASVVYLLNELSAELMTLRWDGTEGRLVLLNTQPLASAGFQGAKSASEMVMSRDGRFLYVGDRGEHTLLVYRLEPATGLPVLLQRQASGGEAPWHVAIHPDGRWLLVAHQRSQRVNLLAIDPGSGRLSDTGIAIDTPSPVSVGFLN